MSYRKQFITLAACLSITALTGCNRVATCDDGRVKALVVQLADDIMVKGFKINDQKEFQSLKTTTISSIAEVSGQSKGRSCQTKLVVKFTEPMVKKVHYLMENDERIYSSWKASENADALQKKLEVHIRDGAQRGTLGLPIGDTPKTIQADIDYSVAKNAIEQNYRLRMEQTKALREMWKENTGSIEATATYSIVTNTQGDGFQVSLSSPELGNVKVMVPVFLFLNANEQLEATADDEDTIRKKAFAKVMGPPSKEVQAVQEANNLAQGKNYFEARELLKKAGWVPMRGSVETLDSVGHDLYDKGAIEVEICAKYRDGPKGFKCKFWWMRDDVKVKLHVTTWVGDDGKQTVEGVAY